MNGKGTGLRKVHLIYHIIIDCHVTVGACQSVIFRDDAGVTRVGPYFKRITLEHSRNVHQHPTPLFLAVLFDIVSLQDLPSLTKRGAVAGWNLHDVSEKHVILMQALLRTVVATVFLQYKYGQGTMMGILVLVI